MIDGASLTREQGGRRSGAEPASFRVSSGHFRLLTLDSSRFSPNQDCQSLGPFPGARP